MPLIQTWLTLTVPHPSYPRFSCHQGRNVGPSRHLVIVHKSEPAFLREYGGLVIYGSIFKAINQTRGESTVVKVQAAVPTKDSIHSQRHSSGNLRPWEPLKRFQPSSCGSGRSSKSRCWELR
jgi:hypothetical protein